jgi:hypothetical protein
MMESYFHLPDRQLHRRPVASAFIIISVLSLRGYVALLSVKYTSRAGRLVHVQPVHEARNGTPSSSAWVASTWASPPPGPTFISPRYASAM